MPCIPIGSPKIWLRRARAHELDLNGETLARKRAQGKSEAVLSLAADRP
jgi:hypothetical protein